jgi:acyl carrier protein
MIRRGPGKDSVAMWDPQFEDILRKYLPYLPAGEPISGDMSLFDAGLDSIGAAELLSVVERTYNVRFVDDALSMETSSGSSCPR